MSKFTTIEHVWSAIDQGRTVYWTNTSYKIYIEEIYNERVSEYQKSHHTHRDGKCLSVRCISNYFGSLLSESEIKNLFTTEEVQS